MDQRQLYAISHPITDPDDPREHARMDGMRKVRRHGGGWLIMSILAVDR